MKMKSFECSDVFPGCSAKWTSRSVRELLIAVATHTYQVHATGIAGLAQVQHLEESASEAASMFGEDADAEASRVDWPQLLERTIRGEGVRCLYQPILDLGSFEIAGYEALTRFDLGPQFGPKAWFAAAKRWDVAAALEATTLRHALSIVDEIPHGVFLTVNIEPETLCSPQVREIFAGRETLNGIAVEITDHRRVENLEEVATTFELLRDAGALISIDQSGSGFAGLPQMLAIRPDILKLDRTFTERVDHDDAKVARVQMTVMFAKQIGARVLAGIETVEEGRRCASLGVALAQGFLVGRPAEHRAALDPVIIEQLRASKLRRLIRT